MPFDWRQMLAMTLIGAGGGNPMAAMQFKERKKASEELTKSLTPQAFSSPTGPDNPAPTTGYTMPGWDQIAPMILKAANAGVDVSPFMSMMQMRQQQQSQMSDQAFKGLTFAESQRQFDTSQAGLNTRSAAELEAANARAQAQQNFTASQNEQNRRNQVNVANIRSNTGGGGPAGPMAGMSIEAQDTNILLSGKNDTPEYAASYNRQATPRVLPDGSRITPDMRAFKRPTFNAEGDASARPAGQPTVQPGGIRSALQMTETMGGLITRAKEQMGKLTTADRAAYQTGVTTPNLAAAQAAFNFVLSQLRDPSLLNTGVLQAGELAWIEKFMAAPGTFSALIQGDAPTIASLDEIGVLLKAKKRGFETLNETPDSAAKNTPDNDPLGLR